MGRLKMCSKSVVFDPKDIMKPIVKISLKDCSEISDASTLSKLTNALSIECNQHVEMLEGNVLAPYRFKGVKQRFLFLLNYAQVKDCLPQICQLHRASSLPAAEQNSMIAAIVHSRQSRVSFDTLWLEDLYETVIMETQANKITALVVNPGRILLTSSRLYFQPYNNIEPYPVLKIYLQEIKRIIKRRFLLRQVGLEVYCSGSSNVNHLFLAFKSPEDRNALFEGLVSQPKVCLDKMDQEMMTLQWQNGVISNYDYLLYLNSLADRTFNDLTQYPVFPWVVSDFSAYKLDLDNPKMFRDLKKPIGALNEVRLKRLKERYEEMSPPKFLYGSHYSAPGFVLFYLVRKFPHYMLCLQNGRFDHPDRMFNSIPDVWKNVMTNMSDFKELIPAFYDTEQAGDFLVNGHGVNFGYRHDGTKIGDVQLPRWADGPEDFVKKHREALESECVSKNLNHWIDLIFGYKQTGDEARKADNLFYYLCYEGAVDLDSIKDLNQRHALEVQIMEFGQIPKQVFTLPHPQRLTGVPPCPSASAGRAAESDEIDHTCGGRVLSWRRTETLAVSSSHQAHREAVTGCAVAGNLQFVVSVGRDSVLKTYHVKERRQMRSVTLSSMALSSCIVLPDDATLVVGCWDNNIVLYNLEFGRVTDSVRAHEDAVSCLAWGAAKRLLASGSWDCSVRVWQGVAEGRRLRPATSLLAQLEHDSHITCLALDRGCDRLVSGTEDGDMFVWSLETNTLLQQLAGHSGSVHGVDFSPNSNKLVSCGADSNFRVLDLTTGMLVYKKTLDEELRCLCWDGFTLLLGGSSGSLYVWDLLLVEMKKQIQAHKGAVLAVSASRDGSIVVTGGEDRCVMVWQPTYFT
ncbi:protein FAN-like isoform X2 [Bacillus rossius redtenbacheri]